MKLFTIGFASLGISNNLNGFDGGAPMSMIERNQNLLRRFAEISFESRMHSTRTHYSRRPLVNMPVTIIAFGDNKRANESSKLLVSKKKKKMQLLCFEA